LVWEKSCWQLGLILSRQSNLLNLYLIFVFVFVFESGCTPKQYVVKPSVRHRRTAVTSSHSYFARRRQVKKGGAF